MATSVATLVNRARRFVRDFDEDVLTASVASNGATLTVADGTRYYAGWLVEIEQEALLVTSNGSGTSVPVRRAQRGTTAASHANSTATVIRPTWLYADILDAFNASMAEMYPKVYKPVLDTSLSPLASTFEYTVPNMPSSSVPIPYLSKIELKETGGLEWRPVRSWTVRRGATPKIQFRFDPSPGSIRVHGYGPFTDLVTGGSLDNQWPGNAEQALLLGAVSYLLASRENDRASGRGLQDDVAEWAKLQGVGAAMSQSERIYARFQREMLNAAMAPMPPHVVPTF